MHLEVAFYARNVTGTWECILTTLVLGLNIVAYLCI